MADVAGELRKLVIEPTEAILAVLARLDEMKLSPVVREHVDSDLRELAKDLRLRLRRENESLHRLRQTITAFESRIIEMDKEHGR
jgi:hypothetical protein